MVLVYFRLLSYNLKQYLIIMCERAIYSLLPIFISLENFIEVRILKSFYDFPQRVISRAIVIQGHR